MEGPTLLLSLLFWLAVCMLSLAPRKLVLGLDPNNPGFISIDCGALNAYPNNDLQIYYETDDGYIDSGVSKQVSSDGMGDGVRASAKTLREFPDGFRNCYTIPPTTTDEGHGKYLIRASFLYDNYDNQNRTPKFNLFIGVNYWTTVDFPDPGSYVHKEIIHVVPPTADAIQVCLVNTGNGTPFISSLELRQLADTMYLSDDQFPTLALYIRTDMGYTADESMFRHPSDSYDRFWDVDDMDNDGTLSSAWNGTSPPTLDRTNDAYKVPIEVLGTFVTVESSYNLSLSWKAHVPGASKWISYLHFAEMENLSSPREFTIYSNDAFIKTISLDYLVPMTVPTNQFTSDIGFKFKFVANSLSSASSVPPIINAVELYYLLDISTRPTDLNDVNAMKGTKRAYNVTNKSWQGDPCVPTNFTWDGVKCSTENSPRITSLNLSSYGLKGKIADSLTNLTALTSLDLSSNQLTGPIPELLAKLPNLNILNLSGNNLTGPIPESLQKKKYDGKLELSVAGNPNLRLEDSGKLKKKRSSFVVPVIAAGSGLVVILSIALAIIWRFKITKGKGQEGTIKLRNRPFTFNEVLKITDNFKTVIGKGGFGKVYLGTLANGTNVAVKMLSQTSKQGRKEFQAEAELLMIVHHRNLVSLVGYCDDAKNMALIYELMVNGNLRQHLSDQSCNAQVLTWNERLRITIDAAQGLDYLHNGCKPPIIHRDLKTLNILLNESRQAKIADFGLSKAFAAENDSSISTRPAGTPGYLDPEYQSSGSLNRKSDVYSFGVILLELITGHPAMIRSASGSIHILHWATPIIERGDIHSIVDPRLDGKFSVNSAWKMVEIAMSCVQTTAVKRPDISCVLAELKDCWAIETASERSQMMGSSKSRSMGSFQMTSMAVDCDSLPFAR
ncbi:senescence-induced receptor-like serine/threonine-protein kinase [Punica granatum]|uniref:non-specific serine/threonine protein kinase n=1 Tax=Punica granatum TaxID=22663 RepID=A0A6P8CNU4_PUNGR|nr:senescence-induced receptor-like serine/threonine-protein kinase [Punica granatum]